MFTRIKLLDLSSYCFQRLHLITTICLVFSNPIFTQSLLPGDIRLEHVNALSYLGTFTIYFDQPEPKEFIVINWGDTQELDSLFNPILAGCNNGIWYGYSYSGIHQYAESGIYTISYEDNYLATGITNIYDSEVQSLLITATLNISESLNNNSPTILHCPIWDWGCCDWIYNPSAYDSDGDSLSYELTPVLNTEYITTLATIDNYTGDFTWIPEDYGNYAIAITIKDWRMIDDQIINLSSVTRYMLLNILDVSLEHRVSKLIDFQIFPNPTSNSISIQLPKHIPVSQVSAFVITPDEFFRQIKLIKVHLNTQSI